MRSLADIDYSNLPGRGIKPLVSLLAHFKIAIIVFILVLLAGMPTVFIKGKPMYEATATMQVAPRYMKNLHDEGELDFPSNTQYREFLEQQTRSVLRYDIVRDALASLGDAGAIWRLPQDTERTAVDRLRTTMSVRTIPDTYMIELSLQSNHKQGVEEIVNAVARVYVERMKTERIFGADVRIKNLESREADLLKVIQEKTAERTKLAIQLSITGFTGKEENPYDKLLEDMRSNFAASRAKRVEAESRLKAFVSNGETDIDTRSVQEAVLIDPGLSNLKSTLYKRRGEILVAISGLEPRHPAYPELASELKRIETEIAAQASQLTGQVRNSLLARYQTTLDQARRIEEDQSRELATQEAKGISFANNYNSAMALTQDIDQNRKELETIRDRLNQFASEQNSFGFVRMVNPALPPELPFGPGKKKIFLMLLIVALAGMVTVPVVIDMLDRRIHTVNDVERTLEIPSLGWMVEHNDIAGSMLSEDLLRRMAAGLIRDNENQGTSVFAFSAVKSSAGNTETVLALARTLNQLGYPTLALEANAFNGDRRFETDRPGLQQCLNGEASAMDCIAPADAKLPSRVMARPHPSLRHLEQIDRIGTVLDEWKKHYRFILVDMPPVLLSADTEILARRLKQLILVVESRGVTIGELKRAGRQLEKIDLAAVGVIVNRVKPFQGGGYLRDLQIEFVSGRKLESYFSLPAWQIALNVWWTKLFYRNNQS